MSSVVDCYKNCDTCWHFSRLFGGAMSDGEQIKTEEKFEQIKEEFVKHFNQSHRNLMEGKDNKIIKYKKMIGESKPMYLGGSHGTIATTRSANFQIFRHETIHAQQQAIAHARAVSRALAPARFTRD